MTNRNDLFKLERIDNGLDISHLLRETISRTNRLIRTAEAEEVNCHHPSTCGYQTGNNQIVNV